MESNSGVKTEYTSLDEDCSGTGKAGVRPRPYARRGFSDSKQAEISLVSESAPVVLTTPALQTAIVFFLASLQARDTEPLASKVGIEPAYKALGILPEKRPMDPWGPQGLGAVAPDPCNCLRWHWSAVWVLMVMGIAPGKAHCLLPRCLEERSLLISLALWKGLLLPPELVKRFTAANNHCRDLASLKIRACRRRPSSGAPRARVEGGKEHGVDVPRGTAP
ncbi:hypothetical protein NDU88_005737 [Pleurodeles waltl]|uniref:Uncharacterized protein n=1 Tax=Pleurodeles waltl TaxID=8319 RepID=A0AAV7NW47_PLEWA|nr:hypothetical protein NDU88_005737 [Pleurodeles waltl]